MQARKAFVRGGLFRMRDSEIIRHARVPLICVKAARIPGGEREVKVDISMGVSNGARAVAFVQRQVQAMPPLRPLVLVLKALLKQYNLNEARKGGLSSYCLLNMVRRYGCAALPVVPPTLLMQGVVMGYQWVTSGSLPRIAMHPGDIQLCFLAQRYSRLFRSDLRIPGTTISAVFIEHCCMQVMAHLQIQGYEACFPPGEDPVHYDVAEQLRYVTHLSHACGAVGVASGHSPGQPDLGHLLVAFLARYGDKSMFDNEAHAVSVRQGGVVPMEYVAVKQKQDQPLVVEDPQVRLEPERPYG